MPKVTVVIPVYGVEKYIERCARSLFEQTLDDIEYIFIDDCSPDNSIAILKTIVDEYPERKLQIRIERMPHNSGLPTVRKRGIELATGDYVIACDSDDWVEIRMYEEMYEYAILNDLDLVHCDIDIVNDNNNVIRSLSTQHDSLQSDELKEMIINGLISNSLCNKLVKRSIYLDNPIDYPVFGMDEDNALAIQLAYFSNKLGYIKKSYYKAFQNDCSITHIPGEDQILKRYKESFKNSELVISFLTRNGYSSKSLSVVKAKIRPKVTLLPLVGKKQYAQLWKDTYSDINYAVFFYNQLPIRLRGRFFLTLLKCCF